MSNSFEIVPFPEGNITLIGFDSSSILGDVINASSDKTGNEGVPASIKSSGVPLSKITHYSLSGDNRPEEWIMKISGKVVHTVTSDTPKTEKFEINTPTGTTGTVQVEITKFTKPSEKIGNVVFGLYHEIPVISEIKTRTIEEPPVEPENPPTEPETPDTPPTEKEKVVKQILEHELRTGKSIKDLIRIYCDVTKEDSKTLLTTYAKDFPGFMEHIGAVTSEKQKEFVGFCKTYTTKDSIRKIVSRHFPDAPEKSKELIDAYISGGVSGILAKLV